MIITRPPIDLGKLNERKKKRRTRLIFGIFRWSILDFQATEIFEYAQKLGGGRSALTYSMDFQKCRFQYAKLLSEYGGFNSNVIQYCSEIARSLWDNPLNATELEFIGELCDLAERYLLLTLRLEMKEYKF